MPKNTTTPLLIFPPVLCTYLYSLQLWRNCSCQTGLSCHLAVVLKTNTRDGVMRYSLAECCRDNLMWQISPQLKRKKIHEDGWYMDSAVIAYFEQHNLTESSMTISIWSRPSYPVLYVIICDCTMYINISIHSIPMHVSFGVLHLRSERRKSMSAKR